MSTLSDAEGRMKGAVDTLRRDIGSLRAGRANPALVERIVVDYYGVPTPLREVAALNVPEPRQLLIQPWDRALVGAIEKAIQRSDLGISPSSDGSVIRLMLPPLTEERRRELVKTLHRIEEEQKVAVRNCRRDGMDAIRAESKDGHVSEDDGRREQEELQHLTDRYVAEIERLTKEKEQEILTV